MATIPSLSYTAMNNTSSISLPSLLHSNNPDTDNDSDFEIESDITDQGHELDHDHDHDHEIPPRPTSRLGFNCSRIQDAPRTILGPETGKAITSQSRSRLKWTRSLFQKIGIAALPSSNSNPTLNENVEDDQDITSSLNELEPVPPSILLPLSSSSSSLSLNLDDLDADEAGISSSDDSDDSDSSSCEDSDIDIDSLPDSGHDILLFPPTPTLSSPTPHAILVPTSPSPSPSPPSTFTPTRQKFSSLPSPLSPFSHISPYPHPAFNPTLQRHNYKHHGYSRHALLHLKWFWAVREDEWQTYTAHLREANAYGGMSILAGTTCSVPLGPPGFNNNGYGPEKRSCRLQQLQQLPPMTIHPRRGDICGLRDPYSAHIDRCFVGLPMWTMAKTLWMFDVHMGVERRARAAAVKDDGAGGDETEMNVESGDDEEDVISLMSTGFSDDSDMTLVESESEGELDGEVVRVDGGTNGGDVEGEEGMEDVTMEEIDANGDCWEEKAKSFERESAFMTLEAMNVDPGPSSTPHNPEHYSRLSKDKASPKPKPQHPSQSAYSSPASERTPAMISNLPPWETNWYKRWELLIELVKLDRDRERAKLDSASSSAYVKAPGGNNDAKLPRFYFAGEGDEVDGHVGDGMGCGDERWGEAMEDEDEEVIIVSNPLFMGRGMGQAVRV